MRALIVLFILFSCQKKSAEISSSQVDRSTSPEQEINDLIWQAKEVFGLKEGANSRFDQFLLGDINQLNEEERAGLKLFMNYGCIKCHRGVDIGGEGSQLLGLKLAYPTLNEGLFLETHDPAHKNFFKVPSLRNGHKRLSYFHQGHVKTLEQAISLMGKHQLGMDLEAGEIAQIKAFLGSLEDAKQ